MTLKWFLEGTQNRNWGADILWNLPLLAVITYLSSLKALSISPHSISFNAEYSLLPPQPHANLQAHFKLSSSDGEKTQIDSIEADPFK